MVITRPARIQHQDSIVLQCIPVIGKQISVMVHAKKEDKQINTVCRDMVNFNIFTSIFALGITQICYYNFI